ncbi:hypothetical protein [Xylophilus ampelinus]|uniref:hypothetical protein n=1 Tax=Xylophilus ampelinus TaxID=54067 RepID=UPI0011B766C0|nr:hypothetical protein [Xylophilus ampelinus]MCS4510666.1 hypothetical protein [Xylophilus ampelinus]
MVESVFNSFNAKAALFAVDEYFEASGERPPLIINSGPVRACFLLNHCLLAQPASCAVTVIKRGLPGNIAQAKKMPFD